VNEALLFISSILHIPIKRWVETSELLRHTLYQRKIEDFIQ